MRLASIFNLPVQVGALSGGAPGLLGIARLTPPLDPGVHNLGEQLSSLNEVDNNGNGVESSSSSREHTRNLNGSPVT